LRRSTVPNAPNRAISAAMKNETSAISGARC
jgi:hypothetical protein